MKTPMTRINAHRLFTAATVAAAALSATAAPAQVYQPQPYYSSAVPGGQSYAAQIGPDGYAIQGNGEGRNYPYVRCLNCGEYAPRRQPTRRFVTRPPAAALPKPAKVETTASRIAAKAAAKFEAKAKAKADTKAEAKADVTADTKTNPIIIRDKPVVRVTKRYVDDPPRVIDREVNADEPQAAPAQRGLLNDRRTAVRSAPVALAPRAPLARDDAKNRTIEADAEVTIIGPDRMSIRLFRKGQRPSAAQD
jgi:hypothetical protein